MKTSKILILAFSTLLVSLVIVSAEISHPAGHINMPGGGTLADLVPQGVTMCTSANSGDNNCVDEPETDPKIADIETNKWCVGTSEGRIYCNQDAPSGGVPSCSTCDTRFVNLNGDAMTGSLSVKDHMIINGEAGTIDTWVGSSYAKTGTTGETNFAVTTNGKNRIYIESDGDIGIGTDSPKADFHIKEGVYGAQLYVTGNGNNDNPVIYIGENEKAGGGIRYDGKDNEIQFFRREEGKDYIALSYSHRPDRPALDIYIDNEDPPPYGISVVLATGKNNDVGILGLSYAGIGIYGQGDTGVKGVGNEFDFYASGTGTNYGSSSSIRWKENIQPIDNPLEKVTNLRGVYFDWDEEHGGQHDMGMIAEEVGIYVPEIVNYEEDSYYAIGMDYSKLTPLLVEAMKEQQKQIQSQQSEIKELKRIICKNNPQEKICRN